MPQENSTPPFDPKVIADSIVEGLKGAKIEVSSQPEKPKADWDKPEEYWLFNNDIPAEEQAKTLHQRVDKFVDHKIQQTVEPLKKENEKLKEELKKHETAFEYLDAAKASDKDFEDSKVKVKEIMDAEGCSYKTAKKIYQLQASQAATAPPKPVPPKTATAPTTSSAPTPAPERRPIGNIHNDTLAIIREGIAKGELQSFGS